MRRIGIAIIVVVVVEEEGETTCLQGLMALLVHMVVRHRTAEGTHHQDFGKDRYLFHGGIIGMEDPRPHLSTAEAVDRHPVVIEVGHLLTAEMVLHGEMDRTVPSIFMVLRDTEMDRVVIITDHRVGMVLLVESITGNRERGSQEAPEEAVHRLRPVVTILLEDGIGMDRDEVATVLLPLAVARMGHQDMAVTGMAHMHLILVQLAVVAVAEGPTGNVVATTAGNEIATKTIHLAGTKIGKADEEPGAMQTIMTV